MVVARTLRDLYRPEEQGTGFAIDGFVPEETLQAWLQKGVLGQTSNQTLLLQRLQEGALDDEIRRLHQKGYSPADIFNHLYDLEASRSAEMLARWVSNEEHLGVSRETDALRANDPEAVAAEAVQIQRLSPRMFVKIANVGATPEQVRATIAGAMVRAFREGVVLNPNITLVFGFHHYLHTVAGFLDGLEAIANMGGDPSPVRSVNSLFVSRLDTATDALIEKQQQSAEQRDELELLKGKVGIAHAKLVYRLFRAVFLNEPFEDNAELLTQEEREQVTELATRWKRLKERFPRLQLQRILLASTSNKKPGVYSELIYVLPLLGPYLANTVPVKTLEALEQFLQERGVPLRPTVFDPLPWMVQNGETIRQWEEAVVTLEGVPFKPFHEVLRTVQERVYKPQGTSLRQLTDQLRDQGAELFARDQRRAYELIDQRIAMVTRR